MEKVTKKCLVCGKKIGNFVKNSNNDKKRKYCSLKCSIISQTKKQKTICEICGKEFYVKLDRMKRYKQVYCSNKCFYKSKKNLTGDKNSNWKGGKKRHKFGYIQIHKPKHPNSDSRGYIMEHKLVIEKWLRNNNPNSEFLLENEGKKYLKLKVIVHHINGIKDDNRIENLKCFKNLAEHSRYHGKLRIYKRNNGKFI